MPLRCPRCWATACPAFLTSSLSFPENIRLWLGSLESFYIYPYIIKSTPRPVSFPGSWVLENWMARLGGRHQTLRPLYPARWAECEDFGFQATSRKMFLSRLPISFQGARQEDNSDGRSGQCGVVGERRERWMGWVENGQRGRKGGDLFREEGKQWKKVGFQKLNTWMGTISKRCLLFVPFPPHAQV